MVILEALSKTLTQTMHIAIILVFVGLLVITVLPGQQFLQGLVAGIILGLTVYELLILFNYKQIEKRKGKNDK